MYEVEFVNSKTGVFKKFQIKHFDWRSAASECFGLQHTLRERYGGTWTFLRLQWLG